MPSAAWIPDFSELGHHFFFNCLPFGGAGMAIGADRRSSRSFRFFRSRACFSCSVIRIEAIVVWSRFCDDLRPDRLVLSCSCQLMFVSSVGQPTRRLIFDTRKAGFRLFRLHLLRMNTQFSAYLGAPLGRPSHRLRNRAVGLLYGCCHFSTWKDYCRAAHNMRTSAVLRYRQSLAGHASSWPRQSHGREPDGTHWSNPDDALSSEGLCQFIAAS